MKRVISAAPLFVVVCISLIAAESVASGVIELSDQERDKGFQLLFNGHDLRGWQNDGNWAVKDGAIVCVKPGANLVYRATIIREPFFELRFQWKVVVAGKSAPSKVSDCGPDGCLYTQFWVARTVADAQGRLEQWGQSAFFYATGCGAVGLLGPEYQLLPGVPTGSCFFHGPRDIAPANLVQWNRGRIVLRGKNLRFWLGGESIIDTEISAPSAIPPETRHVTARAPTVSHEALRGLRVQLEDSNGRLLYRGIKLRLIQVDEG
jgi:hypothetical protein